MDQVKRANIAVGVALAVASLLPCCSGQRGARLVVLFGELWRVGTRGRITPFPYRFPSESERSVQGSTTPLPSPDGRWVAFGDPGGDHDVHLLNVRTLRDHRITHFGKPPTAKLVSADVLIEGWSPDSQRLLLYVSPGEDTSGSGDLSIPAALYGFFDYDLASQRVAAVALPKTFEFIAWLRDGRFVGFIPGTQQGEGDTLTLLRPGEVQGTVFGTVSSHQSSVRADGKWLVTTVGGKRRGTGQIVRLTLPTMSATPLVSLQSWTGNERPALSPDNKHVAYIREILVNHVPWDSLYVDSRKVYACSGVIEYEWVSRRRIALGCVAPTVRLAGQIMTLDVKSGKGLSARCISNAWSQP